MKLHDARIAFFGTSELSVYVLDELAQGGIHPLLVITTPDKPVGRKLVLTPPPVKVWAGEHGVEVLQTPSLKMSDDVEILMNSEWDLFIVAAYNVMLPKIILEIPRLGVLNVHPSLLPKLRGPSPIRTAIRNNEEDSVGVTIMKLDEEMDHGPLIAQATVELPVWPERGQVLDEILFREGGRLLCEVIPAWLNNEITPEVQDHTQATYTQKLSKADGEIDLYDDGLKNYAKFCAHEGWPGTFFFTECNGKKVRIKVTDAIFKQGVFTPTKVIPEGKKEMDFEIWKKSCGDGV